MAKFNVKNINIYKIVTKLFCLLGCVFHLYTLNRIYFSYETTTNVKYEYEINAEIPAISLCFDKISMISYVKYDKALKQYNESNLLDVINNKSIGEQFNLFVSPRRLFNISIYLNESKTET